MLPHPEDIARIERLMSSLNLRVRKIARKHATWRLHYRKGAWHLSRFARFYSVVAQTDAGDLREILAAYDPWRSSQGVQIL